MHPAILFLLFLVPALVPWALAYPAVFAPARAWLRDYHAQMRDYVDAQQGRSRPEVTFLRSKDGTIPFVRLPSGQIRSLKKLSRARAAHS